MGVGEWWGLWMGGAGAKREDVEERMSVRMVPLLFMRYTGKLIVRSN